MCKLGRGDADAGAVVSPRHGASEYPSACCTAPAVVPCELSRCDAAVRATIAVSAAATSSAPACVVAASTAAFATTPAATASASTITTTAATAAATATPAATIATATACWLCR